MTNWDFQLRGVDDPRLAVHATRTLPAWLWSSDGTRVLWANPVAAKLFGAANAAELARRSFRPADPHRRQVAQLAAKLPPNGATRLERLRGFGAPLGAPVTCACTRLGFADGSTGVLIAAVESIGRPMPLIDRLRSLVEGVDTPIAAFASDGLFVGSSAAARTLLGFRNLSEAGLDQARADALRLGRAETPIGFGHLVLQRVGSGADVGLIALLAPGVATEPNPQPPSTGPEPQPEMPESQPEAEPSPVAAPPEPETAPEPLPPEPPSEAAAATASPDYEAFDTLSEAPAEFTLLDDVAPAEVEAEATATPPLAGDADAALSPPATAADEPCDEPASTVQPTTDQPSAAPEPADEPSPFVETVADEPAAEEPGAAEQQPVVAEQSAAPDPVAAEPETSDTAPAAEPMSDTPPPRRHPLRFVWQIDRDGRLAIASDEFLRLIGPLTIANVGERWSEVADRLGLDPDGQVAAALDTHHTWSGITLQWPADGTALRLPIEMSGLPVQDQVGAFAGYRGFGVCRDLAALDQLVALRRHGSTESPPRPQPLSADRASHDTASDQAPALDPLLNTLDTPVDTPKNVLPFRAANDARAPSLTPGENSAFHELARQLAARLESEAAPGADAPAIVADEIAPEPDAAPSEVPEPPRADWLAPTPAPASGNGARDRVLLDLMPVGVLIYRLDRLLYANPAFLARMGFPSVAALEDAGGLDALYVDSGVGESSSSSETGTPITITAAQGGDAAPTEARLFTIAWDGAQALALICSAETASHAVAELPFAPATAIEDTPSAVGAANAEELGAILDTTAEGVLMFDESGQISAANRSAEALFGYGGDALVERNLIELFAPESRAAVLDYLGSIESGRAQSVLDHGLEALGQVREGGLFPLSMTIGRTRADGPNFFAVFRDLSQVQRTETELSQAKRLAERAAGAKADVLARLSHEIRAPLNAIIGFAEVMIEERFGPLGNERYVDYLKDIRASGERVIGIVDDLLDLSRIETGKLDLSFASVNLNELVEQSVAVMQPRANRERIIIRTSLAHLLPTVVADAQALRQIIINLIGTSIHLANAGGQVIVSTALSDAGEVVLRVRDTGNRLNDDELAAALQPFRTPAPSDRTEAAGVSLSLTKALVEANRASFHVKSAPQSGTLIEVVFAHAPAAV
ncbi:PAS/PAC sensor signal transduction histidine kinase [Rhodopseudomonas thermotolerans]|uniref:histidine kinase n=2 Tax=Rhodopseudomonas TaxID=1073 RepID=A0A336JNK1_9BRAD|nr:MULTISPECIES: PAS domain-containing protein [Rhodopseudomonas]RED37951.1 PAS/PAC sensor signal transduction histidine kinase [Rhodopseudomonas pentothenatexigens]REG05144.1 PAS/PAC sensor signal transduction histidine kinase [Rhodopseudomonas thermotolerans]SSW89976.1 PAS/PAC sensor signal transduction histidine kinase [Rhodopseudomonas pentothenatexigens]